MPDVDPTRTSAPLDILMEKQKAQNIQSIIIENKIMESYIRGENYISSEESITAYRFNLECKEAKLKELDNIIGQLKGEEDSFKKIIKKKQSEYQSEISRRDSRKD